MAYIRSVVCFQMDENPPSGRGHHKRHKKGAHSNFDQRKNDERLKQQARKENFPPSPTIIVVNTVMHTMIHVHASDYYFSAIALVCNDFLVPFLYFLSNVIVHLWRMHGHV